MENSLILFEVYEIELNLRILKNVTALDFWDHIIYFYLMGIDP